MTLPIGDYLTRRADILAFQVLYPSRNEQLLVQELVTHRDGGSVVAGIQKLAQTVLMTLLTVRGSRVFTPQYGCDFMRDARSGRWRTPADVTQSFLLARVDVREQVIASELATDPDDERYGGMTLDCVVLSGTTVTLRVSLDSQAGVSRLFLVPLKVVIR